jgi:hypothetical protein
MERDADDSGARIEEDAAAPARARRAHARKAGAASLLTAAARGPGAPEPVIAVLLSRERFRVEARAGESPRDAFARALQRCRGDFNLISRGRPVESWSQLSTPFERVLAEDASSRVTCEAGGEVEDGERVQEREQEEEKSKDGSNGEAPRPAGGRGRATPSRLVKRGRVVKEAEFFIVTRPAMSSQSDCCCAPVRVSLVARAPASVVDPHTAGAFARFSLEVCRQEPVESLRLHAALKAGLPVAETRLVCGGRVLQNGHLCGDYQALFQQRPVGVWRHVDRDAPVSVSVVLPFRGRVLMSIAPTETPAALRERVWQRFSLPYPAERWKFKLAQGGFETVLADDQPFCAAAKHGRLESGDELVMVDAASVAVNAAPVISLLVNGVELRILDAGPAASNELGSGSLGMLRSLLQHPLGADAAPGGGLFDNPLARGQEERSPQFTGFRRGFLRIGGSSASRSGGGGSSSSSSSSSSDSSNNYGGSSSSSSSSSSMSSSSSNINDRGSGSASRRKLSPRRRPELAEPTAAPPSGSASAVEPAHAAATLRVSGGKVVCCGEGCRRLISMYKAAAASKCRCSGVYCSAHMREHACTFDYASAAKEALRKQMLPDKESTGL